MKTVISVRPTALLSRFVAGLLLLSAGACDTPSESAPLGEIQLSATLPFVDVGQTLAIQTSGAEDSGAPVSAAAVRWSSSDTTVLTVRDGVVTGRSPGVAIVTASGARARGQIGVTVESPLSGIGMVVGTAVGVIGRPIRALVFPSYLRPTSTGNHSFTLVSSDTTVVRVSAPAGPPWIYEGLLMPVGVGSATVTVRAGGASSHIQFAVEKPYQLTVLRTPSRRFQPGHLNRYGQAVWYETNEIDSRTLPADSAFFWNGGAVVPLGQGRAWDLNDQGQIAGCSGSDAVVWQNGASSIVHSETSWYLCATAINNAGQLAGYGDNGRDGATELKSSFVLAGGVVREIASPVMFPRAIHEEGWVVGSSFDRDPRPFLWRDGVQTRLPTVSSASQFSGWAMDVNRPGTIVGILHPSAGTLPAMWQGTESSPAIPPLPLDCSSEQRFPGSLAGAFGDPGYPGVYAINDAGVMVGRGDCHGALWRGQQLLDLQYMHSDPQWVIVAAIDINEKGQILAVGYRSSANVDGLLILTPGK